MSTADPPDRRFYSLLRWCLPALRCARIDLPFCNIIADDVDATDAAATIMGVNQEKTMALLSPLLSLLLLERRRSPIRGNNALPIGTAHLSRRAAAT